MKLKNLPNFFIVAAIGCCLFTGTPILEAQTITYQFNGSVDSSGPGVPGASGFSGLFSVDQMDQNPSATAGTFNLSNVLVTFDDGAPSLSQGVFGQQTGFFPTGIAQDFTFSNGLGASLSFQFSSGATDPNTLALIDSGEFVGGFANDVNSGVGFGGILFVDIEVVPEPGGLPLFLLLVARCAFWRRRCA